MKEEKRVEGGLFAAVNSGKGFVSFYQDVLWRDGIERRYLIKGGPGTGKSTLMRRLGEAAVARGLDVEHYRCSSDPESLDAIVIDGRVAVMDATAPHCEEPKVVGAVDRLIDLGAFWDADGLAKHREQIEELGEKKSACYRGAYRFLSAAMAVQAQNRELISPYIRREKLRKAATRAAKDIPDGAGYCLLTGVRSSVGMRGRVTLDTYEKEAESLYSIRDDYGCGSLFLSMLADEAMKKGNRIRVSYCPIDPSYPDAILFEESGRAFVLDAQESRGVGVINMRRFIDRSALGLGSVEGRRAKREYRENLRIYEGLLRSAEDRLAQAGEYHFALEEIYKKYMDFDAESDFVSRLCESILDRPEGAK